ncbi:MAG: T9SS type A sorting domain-containing protein [bacterium]|nr:T9SS type A sorting domain-containing protein [bacterium]
MLKFSRLVIFFALLAIISTLSLADFQSAWARDWVVPEQAPTIQAAMDSCVTGDVVVIQPGLYEDCTHLSNGALHIAVLPVGVSVRGESGNAEDVVLDAGYLGRCFEIRNNTTDFSIENITMRRGRAFSPLGKGGAVFAMFSTPVFRNCVFDSNYAEFGGGGISAGYGDSLIIENCIFTDNETDGIGAAIQVSRTETTIKNTTINGSRGASIHYATDGVTLENCLITNGANEALVQNSENDPDPVLSCCDLYGNDEDYSTFFEGALDQDGNISQDPLYCNPLFGDLQLYSVSPCAEENSGDCGTIGALGVGCGTGASTYVIQADGSGDFPTIQAAINIAATGDTIFLADGTFTGTGNRNIDYLGKAVTIAGLSGDPAVAIIDCQGSLEQPQRGFYFHSNELSTSVLKDISVTNGNVGFDGGAILCESSPLIENCHFYQNHADRGGAIFCDHGSPEIKDCKFSQNEGRFRAGGVGLLSSEAMIVDSLFTANWGYMGAALFLPDSSAVTMTGCTLTNNANSLDKATIGLDGNSSIAVHNCIIANGPHFAFGEYDQGSASIVGSDVYGHGQGDYTGPVAGQLGNNGNISLDPLYCDEGAGDFTLRGDSPCAAASAPNGVRMGNQPVGCNSPAIFSNLSANIPENTATSSGVSLVDWNNDGQLDFLITNEGSANEGYDGAGNWTYAVHESDGATFYLGSVAGAFGDFDRDGDLDLYLSSNEVPNLLVENDGGVFSIVGNDSLEFFGNKGQSSWADYNGDGFLDVFVASTDGESALMKSDGEGSYTNETVGDLSETGNCVSSSWADYDNDGDPDLYLVHDGEADKLLKNGDGFTLIEESPLGNIGSGRGVAWGDYDNDGDLDLYLAIDDAENQLLRNDGDDEFTAIVAGPMNDEGPGRSGIWGDWDNDGDLDFFLTNNGTADHLLRNNAGTFADTGDPVFAAPDSSQGAAFGDLDNDGDLDIVVAIRNGGTRLYRNNTINENHWLKLDLKNVEGMAGGLGARAQLFTDDDKIQIREVTGSSGWHSSDDVTVHFGLGAATMIDSLYVTWPGGEALSVVDVAVDQLLVMVDEYQNQLSDVPESWALRPFRLDQAFPNPFNPVTTIRFAIPESRDVSLQIYDVAGRRVRTLVSEYRSAGNYSEVWRGRDDAGRTVAAGVYFYRLESGRFQQTRTLTLVK